MPVYLSRYVIPVSSRPIPDAAIVVDGERITAVGSQEELSAAIDADPEPRDLGQVAVLPGLVNAHTHLELSWMGSQPPAGGNYVPWVRDLLHRRADEDAEQARAAAAEQIEGLIATGTVAVGEVANATWTASLLARSELHAVVFHEIYGFRAADAERLLAEAIDRLDGLEPELRSGAGRVRVVLTPHAPHTTSAPLLRALAGRAAAAGEPLSIHVAESLAEAALLRDGSGPLPALLRERDVWDDAWLPPEATPVAYLARLGLLSERSLAVHCVQLDRQDHSWLQSRGVTVVACPRSNKRLGVGTAPIPELLREGIAVALGTDSLASAPDLDLFAEMAALRKDHPALAPAAVVRMATFNGARALGLADRLGSIEPGKLARLVVVPLTAPDDDPLLRACSRPEGVAPLLSARWEAARR